jgi:hypothetical protein
MFCDRLVYFMASWYIFPRFGLLYQEKSGNPALRLAKCMYVIDRSTLIQLKSLQCKWRPSRTLRASLRPSVRT